MIEPFRDAVLSWDLFTLPLDAGWPTISPIRTVLVILLRVSFLGPMFLIQYIIFNGKYLLHATHSACGVISLS